LEPAARGESYNQPREREAIMSESTELPIRVSGRCLCGGVRYDVRGPMRPVIACHCNECRRFSGGIWNATAAIRENLTIHDSGSLTWYRSSEQARRGFCGTCGSNLFIDFPDRPYVPIAAGTLDKPTGLRLAVHIFTREAGDYYEIGNDLPKFPDANHQLGSPEDWE